MTCPVCHAPMLKALRRPDDQAAGKIHCVRCRFEILFRGLRRERKEP